MIEDNELNQLLLKQLLKKIKGNHDFVFTAEEGLEKIKNTKYNYIISDIQLPGISGLEIIHKIKKEIKDFSTPIIVVTADVSEDLKKEIEQFQFCQIITKPIQRNDLYNILSQNSISKNKKKQPPQRKPQSTPNKTPTNKPRAS